MRARLSQAGGTLTRLAIASGALQSGATEKQAACTTERSVATLTTAQATAVTPDAATNAVVSAAADACR